MMGDSVFERGVVEPERDDLPFAAQWGNPANLPTFAPISGLFMQSLSGERVMLNWVTIEPNAVVPRHQHPHEQAGVMLSGELALTIGDETRVLHHGDGYVIPPGLPHSAAAGPEGCVVVDVFSPPREDYLAMIGQAE